MASFFQKCSARQFVRQNRGKRVLRRADLSPRGALAAPPILQQFVRQKSPNRDTIWLRSLKNRSATRVRFANFALQGDSMASFFQKCRADSSFGKIAGKEFFGGRT